MIRRVRVIDVGPGSPDHVTVAAARALASVDVVLVATRRGQSTDLRAAGAAICDALLAGHDHRFVEVPEAETFDERVDAYASVIDGLEGREGREETAGVLVLGDPVLFDASVALVEALVARWSEAGLAVESDVVPGVSAPQLLAARHRVPLHRVGAAFHVTTGDRLVDEYDSGLADVAVVHDERLACAELVDAWPDLELFWGAHLGTPDEVLVCGRLGDAVEELRRVRAAARERHGWIVDAYLLRPPAQVDSLQPGSDRAPWPEVTALTDGVLTLRPTVAADWPVLLAEHNNDESMRWGFTSEPLTEVRARRQATEAAREWRRGSAARFTMVDAATGAGAGLIMVARMGPPGIGLIGYGVLPEFRGRGFTTRALRLLVDWVFAQTSVDRLELGHKVDNIASGRAAARAGFVLEGRHAGRLPNPDGTRSDELYYGLVRPTSSAPPA